MGQVRFYCRFTTIYCTAVVDLIPTQDNKTVWPVSYAQGKNLDIFILNFRQFLSLLNITRYNGLDYLIFVKKLNVVMYGFENMQSALAHN